MCTDKRKKVFAKIVVCSVFQWNLSIQKLNVSLTIADWQHGRMFFSFAVCPLKSQKSVLISALIWQNTASCTVSPLPFPSPGTAIFTHTKDWSFLGGVGSMNRFLLNYCLRLAKLLGHDYILKPKYDVVSCDTVDVWLSCSHVASALAGPLLIEASCPLTMKGMSLQHLFILFHM